MYSTDRMKRKVCLSVSYNSSKGQTFTLSCIYMKSFFFFFPKRKRRLLSHPGSWTAGRCFSALNPAHRLQVKRRDMNLLWGWKQKPINQTSFNNLKTSGECRTQRNEGLCVVDWEFPECKVAEWERGLSRRAFHSPTYSFKPVQLHLDCYIDKTLSFYSLPTDSYEIGRGYPLSPHPPFLPETRGESRWGGTGSDWR